MDAEQQQRILGYFLQETQEHLATLRQAVTAMTQPLTDPEQVSDWFRAAHSIKGGAAMLGLDALQQLALRVEDCLKILRDQGAGRDLRLSEDIVALFQQGVTALAELVSHLEQQGSIPFEVGQQVVIEHEPVFIQLEALLQILVQGEQVMAGWETTVPDGELPGLEMQPEPVEAVPAGGEEELDLEELFASLDAPVAVTEAVAAVPVTPTNTSQELASLAELFSLGGAEEGESSGETVTFGEEQTAEELGALADLFSLGDEPQTTTEPVGFDLSDMGVNAEAMALEALSNLEPLPGNELGEFSFESFESTELTEPFGEADLGLTAELTQTSELDFTAESGADIGAFNFESFESTELTEPFGEPDLGVTEELTEIPELDFTAESGVDIGEFSFESFESTELTESFGEGDLGLTEESTEIPELDFTAESGVDIGEFNFESFESTELTESFGEPDLGVTEELTEIPELDFTAESGVDIGEFSFESFESTELTESFGEPDLGVTEELTEAPELDFTAESGVDVGEFSFESFGEDLAEETTGLEFTAESGVDIGEFSFESFESAGLTESFGEGDLGLTEESTETPELGFTAESGADIGAFNFESFGEDLAEETTGLEFTTESGVDVGEFNFESFESTGLTEPITSDVGEEPTGLDLIAESGVDIEDLGEFSFSDVPEIPDELSFANSGLLGDVGSDLETTLAEFAGLEQAEPPTTLEDVWAETNLESLDQEIANLDELATAEMGQDGELDLDFDSLGVDEPDLTPDLDLELPDLPDLENLDLSGSELSPETDLNLGDLEQLLSDVPPLELELPPSPPTPAVTAPEPTPVVAESRTSPLMDQTMRVPIRQLDNLSNLIGELVVSRNTLSEDQNRLRQFLENLLYQAHQLNDLSQRMQDLYERSLLEGALSASRGGGVGNFLNVTEEGVQHSTGAEFDALEMDRFTGFHTLSQEIAERVLRVRESASDIGFMVEALDEVVRSFQRITTGLQEGINNARMEPFSRVTDRLPRAVRNVALKCGKQVTLEIEGRETLVDKMILEKLTDPMTHLVNNAIVHGIGTPAQRQAAGQPPAGRIVIRAAYQGNQTVITVSDDGVGINPDRVKAKAIEKGVITPEQAATMTKQDIYQLLFAPGFSTKDQADEFAGRGVGLDVVRSNLADIRGTVVVDSELGKGTTFTIRLPLTLSISKSLPCVVSHAQVAFPMDGVADVPVDVTPDMIHTGADGKPTLDWGGQRIPLRQLSELLHYGRLIGRGNIYGTSTQEGLSIVVVHSLGRYVAFQVNQVLSEQEVVIKQLSGPVRKPLGIAGATILGDGRIMMIADILELVDLALGQMPAPSIPLWAGATPIEPETTDEPTVLIVDDSITVREMLSMTFSNKGYRVEQARDGLEAWEKLQDGLPCDLMFCDIEMPRMDGLELLSKVRRDANLRRLPIAMLTSRGAERHRQMAIQLGANAYFTKPYLEETLLEAARRLLEGESLVAPAN